MLPAASFRGIFEDIGGVFASGLRPLYRTAAAFMAPLLVYLLLVDNLPLPAWASTVANLIPAFTIVFAWAALTRLASDVLAGQKPLSPSAYAAAVLRRAGLVLAVSIAFYVVEVVGLILLVVPAVWLGVTLSLALAVAATEDVGFFDAFTQSYHLVHGAFWTVFAALLVTLAVTIALPGVLDLPFLLGRFTTGLAYNNPFALIWTAIIWTLVVPLLPTTLAVLHANRQAAWERVETYVERDQTGQQLTE